MSACKVTAPRHNVTKTLEFNEIEENSSCLKRYLKNTLLKKHTEEKTHFQKQKRNITTALCTLKSGIFIKLHANFQYNFKLFGKNLACVIKNIVENKYKRKHPNLLLKSCY